MKFKFLFFALLVGSFFGFSSCEKRVGVISQQSGILVLYNSPRIDNSDNFDYTDNTNMKILGEFYPDMYANSGLFYKIAELPKKSDLQLGQAYRLNAAIQGIAPAVQVLDAQCIWRDVYAILSFEIDSL